MTVIINVYQQIVSGKNFRVFFVLRGSDDLYEVKVYVPLANSGQQTSIVYIKKNNVNFSPISSGNIAKG